MNLGHKSSVGVLAGGDAGPNNAVATFPCSLAQQRFWFLEQFDAGNPSLNVAVRWRMNGVVSDAAVQFAFQTLADRHEILRTRYVDHEGEPRQLIAPTSSAKITLVDLSRLTPEQRAVEMEAISVREAQRPFDLSAAPPVRLAMLRLDETSIVILLTMHHIATDGWTMGLLSHEFGVLVASAMGSTTPPLPPLEMQFADYALWQTEMLGGDGFAADADYWRQTLAGLPRFEVAPDRPRAGRPGPAGDFRLRNIPVALMDPVEAWARRQGQTMFSTAATALALALAAETGNADVVMGTQVAGREDLLLEPIAGLFINTVVLRFDLRGAGSGRAANEICRRVVDGALEHQRFPFEKLVEMLNPPRDPSRTPLYSVNFTLIRPVIQSESFGDIDLVSLPSQMTGAQYDLLFFMVKRDDGWRMVCESSSTLYNVSTVDRILARWEGALQQLADDHHAELKRAAQPVPENATAGIAAAPVHSAAAAAGSPLVAQQPVADTVLDVWRDMLGRRDIDLHSNFFDCGGHSLLALRMLARVRLLTGKSAPVAVLFENPVLGDFVAAIGGDATNAADAEIARIQPLGWQPPVIVLNDGAVFHAVARHIGLDRPFIDLHLARTAGSFERQHETLEQYAAAAVQLIKRAQPNGPYTLMGHCVLGTVAFEAAQQLRKAGDIVSLVVLLDVLAPRYVEDMPIYDRSLRRLQLLGGSWRYFNELLQKMRAGQMTLGGALFQYGFIRRSRMLPILEKLGVVKRGTQTPEDYSEVIFGNHLVDARRNYHLKPYAGDVLQFRASTARDGRLFDRGFGWERWIAGQYDVIDVPGDHFNMMRDPAASVIGTHVALRLNEIEAKSANR